MKRRILAVLLTVVMAVCVMTIAVSAETTVVVDSAEALQAALDNYTSGTTIQLVENVDYGIVYLRPSPTNPATKGVDWIGNNYGYETYSCFENMTILGADGATIDAIVIEGGTYYYSTHSQSATYPVMLSLIELKNVVIDGVTFNGEGGYDPEGYSNILNFAGCNIKVNDLTVKDCVINDTDNDARLLYKTESTTHVHNYAYGGVEYTFTPDLSDITVTGCTFNGGYMGLELRETNNLTISNNTFNGVTSRDILLATNSGCTFSGTVTITDNVSNGAGNRFVRADGLGNATVIISDNTITNYKGSDNDFIKVSAVTGTCTIEDNTIDGVAPVFKQSGTTYTAVLPVAKIGSTSYADLATAIAAAGADDTVVLLEDVKLAAPITIEKGKTITLDLNGKVISGERNVVNAYGLIEVANGAKLTVKDSGTDGKITYAGATGMDGAVIWVQGEFILESGTIEATGSWNDLGAAVDLRPNAWGTAYTEGASFVMNGGKAVSVKIAVRIMDNSAATRNTPVEFVMNGGVIEGSYGIALHSWNVGDGKSKTPEISLAINDGTINATSASYPYAVYIRNSTADASEISIDLTGGTYNGDVILNAGTTLSSDNVSVSGGTYNGEYGLYNYATQDFPVVSGGTFTGTYGAYYANKYIEDGFTMGEDGKVNEIFTVTVVANPTAGGTVTGSGEYADGTTATVTATPNENYHFNGWAVNGQIVSTSATYTFTVTADVTVEAVFKDIYTVNVQLDPANAGTVTGAGSYVDGTLVTLTATAAKDYRFYCWTVNGNIVGHSETYTFIIDSDITVKAVFLEDNAFDIEEWNQVLAAIRKLKYKIAATAGEGGSITSEGTNLVKFNANVTYKITADEGYKIADVKVNGKSIGAVKEYTFKKVRGDQTISVTFEKIGWSNPFTDVKANDWFYGDVEFVYENDLMVGTSDTKFEPASTANRAMIVTILWRLEGEPAVESANAFTDVAEDQWYTTAIAWAAENGIVNGFGDNTFRPTEAITVEQMVAIINRYADYKNIEDKAASAEVEYTYSDWAAENVAWADANGLFNGIELSDLATEATRADVAAILHRFCK